MSKKKNKQTQLTDDNVFDQEDRSYTTTNHYEDMQRAQIDLLQKHMQEQSNSPRPAALVAWESAQRAKGIDPDSVRSDYTSSGSKRRPDLDGNDLEQQAKDKARDLKRALSAHKLVRLNGRGPFACSLCLNVYLNAGNSRAAGDRHHQWHLDEIQKLIENRGQTPEFSFE
jgi:hypothetical protein